MSTFLIDFFELGFLAEACIPPSPIARAMFWENLTNIYWGQMTEDERCRLFEWMQRNDYYKNSLKENKDTQIFHARFDPDNQYLVTTKYNRKKEEHRCFKFNDIYYTFTTKYIADEYIIDVKQIKINEQ